jgi:hypothetical protein
VLELVDLVESALPREEVIALSALLHDLVIQLGQSPSTPERDALLAIARERFGHIWIEQILVCKSQCPDGTRLPTSSFYFKALSNLQKNF